MQDASAAEANAANSVFGDAVQILMCWYHVVYNVKKHDSFKKLPGDLKSLVFSFFSLRSFTRGMRFVQANFRWLFEAEAIRIPRKKRCKKTNRVC